MSSGPTVDRHPDLDILSSTLARRIAEHLAAAIAARGAASLVVSGGRSPVRLFHGLRALPIDWSKVHVTLADERWVPVTDPSSNEKLVRDVLLQEDAVAAHFFGLKNPAATAALGAAAAWSRVADIPRPFDLVLLGMGDDGHTASLFPVSSNLDAGLDLAVPAGCIGMTAPTAPQERLSLNLSALLDSRRIVILITGDSKWRTYLTALQPGPVADMPIRAILRQTKVPVDVMWSP